MQSLLEFLTNNKISDYNLYDINRIKLENEMIKYLDQSDISVLRYEIKDEKYHIYTDVTTGGC